MFLLEHRGQAQSPHPRRKHREMWPDHTYGHYGAEEGPETNQKHRQTFHEEKLKRASLLTIVWTGKRAEGHGENYPEAQGKQG